MNVRRGWLAAALIGLSACSSFGAVYPPRPVAAPSEVRGDPAPSRLVTHVSVTGEAIKSALDANVPRDGRDTVRLLLSDREYQWNRTPFEIEFSRQSLVLTTSVRATLSMPLGNLEFPIDIRVSAEPVIADDYALTLQSVEVTSASSDKRLVLADHVASVFGTLSKEIAKKLKAFRYDLRPVLEEALGRVTKPVEMRVGDANSCARVRLLGVEAGPTVLAGGIEKDLAFVVAPEVTMPCPADALGDAKPGALPPLSNVAQIPSGPFTLSVPIAARYDELAKAMGVLFTNGKYHFSEEFPDLYIENPEVYDSQGKIVLKVHLHGPVKKFWFRTELDGDIFFSGHLVVSDNEIQIPDLEPTIETNHFLLSLKAMSDGQRIRDQARNALRIDLGARLAQVRDKLSTELSHSFTNGCFQSNVDKIDVVSAHTHGTYLRVLVNVTGRALARMPCATKAGGT